MTITTLALIADYVVFERRYFGAFVQEWFWQIVVVLTAGSVVLSLVYSEYFGFIPCSLCWLQRIAVYPQALLVLVAWRQRDTQFFPLYGMWLSAAGLVIAIYHYIYQMFPSESGSGSIMPCLADGSNADCAEKILNYYGFITFPFISAVTFALLIVLYLYMRRQSR